MAGRQYFGSSSAQLAQMRMAAKISKIYAQAYQEIDQKLADHTAKFKAQDAQMVADAKAGKISWKQYHAWKKKEVFTGKHFERVKKQIDDQITKANGTAVRIINGERKAVFQDNANVAMYQIDKDFNYGISFNLIDSATLTRLLEDDHDLLPDVYIDDEKTIKWDGKVINSSIVQSIIQGETIPETAARIAQNVVGTNQKSAVRVARTAMTSAQNAGRIQAMHSAQDLGIDVEKLWIATLDNRTRDAHQNLDGQTAKVDSAFESDLGPIMFPGDPNADPANVWNCRCALGWEYPKYRNQYDTRAARDEDGNTIEIPDMTYREWEALKSPEKQPQNIVKPPVAGQPTAKQPDVKQPDAKQPEVRTPITNAGQASDFAEMKDYLEKTYNLKVSGGISKLDFDSVKNAISGYEDIAKTFSRVVDNWSGISTLPDGVMASNGRELFFNPEYFGTKGKIEKTAKEMIRGHYWPDNANVRSIGAHEAAHGVEWAILTERFPKQEWRSHFKYCTVASGIVYNAAEQVKNTEYGKGKSRAELIKSISGYATSDDSEAMAEAFNDYIANGEKANPLSIAIYKETVKQYKETFGE